MYIVDLRRLLLLLLLDLLLHVLHVVQLAVVLFMSMKSRIRDHPENDRVLRVELTRQ